MLKGAFRVGVVVCVALAQVPAISAEGPAQFLDHDPDPDWDVTQARGRTYDVDFATDEGTWMSVDISPDSQWIVFDMLGHIYRLPLAGGTATSLTQGSGVALNYHPRISPDGRSIAFVSDRGGQANLWIMDADGRNPRIVFSDPISRITGPTWAPDGNSIYAVREFPTYSMHRRSARIWRFPVQPGGEPAAELVGAPSGTQAYWPTVTGDNRSLYFMASGFAEPLHGLQRNQHIRRLDLGSGRIENVTAPTREREYRTGTNNELAPEVSPNGRWLAFARRIPGGSIEHRGHRFNERSALWIRDLRTGEERVLIEPITLDMQGAHGMKNLRILPGYAWTRDSNALVIWRDGKLYRHWLDGRVDPIPFEARVRRTVSERIRARGGIADDSFTSSVLRWPQPATNNQFVFEAVGEIWVAPATARSTAKPIVRWSEKAAHFMPNVSADGARLAFVSWNDRDLGRVNVCDLRDCRPQGITTQPAVYMYPTWDRTGSRLYVFRGRESDPVRIAAADNLRFDLVELQGGSERVIQEGVTPAPLSIGSDGAILSTARRGDVNVQAYLAAGRPIPGGETVLSAIRPDDPRSKRDIARFPTATAAVLSPDSRRIAYIEEDELYVAPAYRSQARYATDQENYWQGESLPQAVVKENPQHRVRRISSGGATHIRWLDQDRILYAAAGTLHIYNVASGVAQRFAVQAAVATGTPPKGRRIALANARIIPMTGSHRVIESGTVIVDGGRIACVGVCTPSASDRVVDLAGRTVVPGFVDVHAHGGFANTDLFPQNLAPQALYMAHGVTTTLDPSVSSDAFFPVAELIRAGRVIGPRSYATGESLLPDAPQTGPANFAEAGELVRRRADLGARSIKIFLTPRRDQRQMLGEWARRLGLTATNEGGDLYYNVGSILDGHAGFEHPLHYMTLYRDAVEFFGRTGATYSPTLIVAGAGRWAEEYHKSRQDLWRDPIMRRFLPWQALALHRESGVRPIEEYSFPIMAGNVAAIRAAGGHATIGGHGELWGRDSHWEMWTYAAAADPYEVLAMATRDGAWMLGLEREIGTIEPGKVADLVILNADPLADIRNTTAIASVMIGGRLYDSPSLDRSWPSARPYGIPPWFDAGVLGLRREDTGTAAVGTRP